jgi:hypothetical protein
MVINEILVEQLLNESESTTLDFKEQQYKFVHASDDEKSELLKDILSFANAFRRTDAFILIGVKEIKGDRSVPVGIVEDLDDATLQQFVNHKTQKPVTFLYHTIPFQGVKLGIIQIPVQERPLYLLKDYGKLLKEAVYTRHGTSTDIASPDEVARMRISLGSTQTYEPILKLQFGNGSDQVNFELTRFENLTTEDTKRAMEEFKDKYPKEIRISGTSSIDALSSISSILAQTVYGNPKIKEEYFKYLDVCYSEYERYLNKNLLYEKQQRGKIQLDIELINLGTLPAEDVDIFINFPDGFELLDNKKILRQPEEPKPFSFAQYPFKEFINLPNIERHLSGLYSPTLPKVQNVSNPTIRKSNGYDVHFHVRRLKHNQEEKLAPLFPIFDSFEAVQSFSLDYKIQAGNVPVQIDGKLNVEIIKK